MFFSEIDETMVDLINNTLRDIESVDNLSANVSDSKRQYVKKEILVEFILALEKKFYSLLTTNENAQVLINLVMDNVSYTEAEKLDIIRQIKLRTNSKNEHNKIYAAINTKVSVLPDITAESVDESDIPDIPDLSCFEMSDLSNTKKIKSPSSAPAPVLPTEDEEADVPRKPILGKRSPIL